jgi:hypothetical protein
MRSELLFGFAQKLSIATDTPVAALLVTTADSLIAAWPKMDPAATRPTSNPSDTAARSSLFPSENCIDMPLGYEFVMSLASLFFDSIVFCRREVFSIYEA